MSSGRAAQVDSWLARWQLTPDGEPLTTPSSVLLPVRSGGVPAMLKLALVDEERRGGAVLAWWGGDGAARVLAREGAALLMERVDGPRSLAETARAGGDDAATRVLCAVAARLHAPRPNPPPEAHPLESWFAELWGVAERHGGVLARAAEAATSLLAEPREVAVLHGDLHHGNVLDGSERGWLAIDPKGLLGERGYDFANIFCNPDLALAVAPGRLERQLDVVAEAAGLERERLLRWVLAYAGLSAAWTINEGDEPDVALPVAEIAAGLLGAESR